MDSGSSDELSAITDYEREPHMAIMERDERPTLWAVIREGEAPRDGFMDECGFYPTRTDTEQALAYWDRIDPGYRHVVYSRMSRRTNP